MATKKSAKKYDPEVFTKKLAKLDEEYHMVLAHIELLKDRQAEIEAEIQALLDSVAGLSV